MISGFGVDVKPNKGILYIASRLVLAASLFALLILCLAACGKGPTSTNSTISPSIPPSPTAIGTPLAFETVEQEFNINSPNTKRYDGREPRLIIISRKEDILLLDETVSEQALATLEKVDFDRYFIAAIYQGLKGNMESGVTVQNISRLDRSIYIYASFIEPKPGTEQKLVETSPYHVIKIPREGIQGKVDFILKSDGQTVIEETHTFD